jgi:hypothetical protein
MSATAPPWQLQPFPAYTLYKVFSPGFFAEYKMAMAVALVSVGCNIAGSLTLHLLRMFELRFHGHGSVDKHIAAGRHACAPRPLWPDC